MRCPDPIAEVLTEILQVAMLRIRIFGQQGESRKCVHEADHVHNLPVLLCDYHPELLDFYWNVERPLLLKQLGETECVAFNPLWERLCGLISQKGRCAEVSANVSRDVIGA